MRVSKRVLFYELTHDSTLVISTLTGAVDVINPQIYNSLLNKDSSENLQIDELTLKTLIKRGYLFEDDSSEMAVLQLIANAYKKTRRKLEFVVCPTYSCNLRCNYCFEGNLTYNNRLCMSDKDIDHVFDAIDSLSHIYSDRKFSVELFGGEPLLPNTKRFVVELFKQARKRSLPVGITTNGTHLQLFLDELRSHRDMIAWVTVTIDGPKKMHDIRRKTANNKGTFDQACSAINALLGLQIKTSVRVNIDRQNLSSIPDLFVHMNKSGWLDSPYFACNLSPVQDHTLRSNYGYRLSEDELVGHVFNMFKEDPRLEKTFRLNMFRTIGHIKSVLSGNKPVQPLFNYCEANTLSSIVFGPDGYLYACTECMGNKELAIGSFRPELEICEDAIKMWTGRNVLTMKKCRECDIALLCGGGCAYSALAINGDINEPVCNRARETILAYLDYVKDEIISKASA